MPLSIEKSWSIASLKLLLLQSRKVTNFTLSGLAQFSAVKGGRQIIKSWKKEKDKNR